MMRSAFTERPTWPSEGSKGRVMVHANCPREISPSQAVEHPTQLFGLLGQKTSRTFLVLDWPSQSGERLDRLT